ncbi:MAG: hypothetical protein ABL886_10940, partial [Rhodoglobus sp.]
MRLTLLRLAVLLVCACFLVAEGASAGAIQNLTVFLGDSLSFTVGAPHERIAVSPLPLPVGASFDIATRIFAFSPNQSQVGTTFALTFKRSSPTGPLTSEYTIAVLAMPTDGPTVITGRVYAADPAVPLANVEVGIPGQPFRRTRPNGSFWVNVGAPTTSEVITIDGQNVVGGPYAFVAEDIELLLGHPLYPGQRNVVSRPIFIPHLGAPAGQINPGTTSILTSPTVPGLTMSVAAGSARLNGTLYAGPMYIPSVPPDNTPAALPANLRPGVVIAIQPAGITFTPPAQVTFPNYDGLTANSVVNIWSVNPASGTFEIAGTGRVTSNGISIVTISGGISVASWHFAIPAAPNGNSDTTDSQDENQSPPENPICVGSDANVQTGNLSVDHVIPAYWTMGVERALR